LREIEVLLLETSGSSGNNDKVKINFDHHKGVSDALAMLKCISDEFAYGSVKKFKKIKVLFVHAEGKPLLFLIIRKSLLFYL
jgi:hypothetical protein